MANIELLLEAEKRGILPPDKADLLTEARKRGLVPGAGGAPAGSARRAEDQSMATYQANPPDTSRQPVTLEDRAQDVFGFKDYANRGTILPFGEDEKGNKELALPQIAVDMATSALLPGHVAQGGQFTPTDVSRLALDFTPGARSPASRPPPPTKREFVKGAPSADDLQAQSQALYAKARSRGIMVDGESFFDVMSKLEGDVGRFGTSKTLHPTATGVLEEWSKRLGKDLSLEELEVMRREAGEVAKKGGGEGVIGAKMQDAIDDFIDGLSPNNVLSGDPSDVADTLKQARALWQRRSKVNTINEVIADAEISASGFENGLRTGFRAILRNPKKRRGFTRDELAAMKKVANGGPARTALRFFSHLGPPANGSNRFLGSMIGMTTGAAGGSLAGGPAGAAIGSVAVPALGNAAGRAAARSTSNAANYARALSASGGQTPNLNPLAERLMRRGAGPAVGAQLPQEPYKVGPNGGVMINGVEVF